MQRGGGVKAETQIISQGSLRGWSARLEHDPLTQETNKLDAGSAFGQEVGGQG